MDFMKNVDDAVDSIKEDLIESLSEFVKIPSVKADPEEGAPFGRSIRSAQHYFTRLCESFGLLTTDGDGYYGYADFGDGQEMLGVFGHLDVVPPGKNWSVDPFSGAIVDGKMISRGTMDDKGALISALYAMAALKNVGFEPRKKIRLFFGCDEESGFACIDAYVKKERVPEQSIVVDGNFPVTYYEKGIFHFTLKAPLKESGEGAMELLALSGGEKLNIVAGEAQAVLRFPESLQQDWMKFMKDNENGSLKVIQNPDGTFTLHATGRKAHSSVAEKGISAISLLICSLATLPVEGREFFQFFADHVGMTVHGDGLGINSHDEESGHLTVNPGKVLLENGHILLKFDVRYPVTTNPDAMATALLQKLDNTPIELVRDYENAPMRTAPDGFLVRTLMKLYEEYTGLRVTPAAMGGNTYAHVLPEAAAFGPNHPGKTKLAHMADENVPLEDLVLNAKLYARAIYELTR